MGGNSKVAVNGTGLKCCQQKGDPDADTYTFPLDSVDFPDGCEGIVDRGKTNLCIGDLQDLPNTGNDGRHVVTCQAMCNFYKELQPGDASTGACNSKPGRLPPAGSNEHVSTPRCRPIQNPLFGLQRMLRQEDLLAQSLHMQDRSVIGWRN